MTRKFVGCRIDDTTYVKMAKKCGGMGCSPAEYLRALIEIDVEDEETSENEHTIRGVAITR